MQQGQSKKYYYYVYPHNISKIQNSELKAGVALKKIMLARKQSLVGDPILLASDYGPEETSNEGSDIIWTSR